MACFHQISRLQHEKKISSAVFSDCSYSLRGVSVLFDNAEWSGYFFQKHLYIRLLSEKLLFCFTVIPEKITEDQAEQGHLEE